MEDSNAHIEHIENEQTANEDTCKRVLDFDIIENQEMKGLLLNIIDAQRKHRLWWYDVLEFLQYEVIVEDVSDEENNRVVIFVTLEKRENIVRLAGYLFWWVVSSWLDRAI